MEVKYVNREKLNDHFGIVLLKEEKIFIRKDLPALAKEYVLEHEKLHLIDYKNKRKYTIIWSEIRANIYGFFKRPIGAILTAIMSLSPSRLKLYLFNYKKEIKNIDKKLNKK